MKLIVGLGNPGKSFSETRHNLGFLIIDRVATLCGILIDGKVCESAVGEGALNEEKIVLAKPQMFMNRSGLAVAGLAQVYGVSADALIVITDDIDLPFGRIRIRSNGGAGGHRGLVSIMENLGGPLFARVRVGIGRPPPGKDPADYVLESFDVEERKRLNEVIDRAAQSVVCLVREGLERAMAQYNRAMD